MKRTQRTKASHRNAKRVSGKDAIALLKADHRQVEKWFGQIKKSRRVDRKADLAQMICNALKVHTTIEEEFFYPAFLAATGDMNLHHEAEVEHAGAKNLIAQIESMNSSDDYFDAKVKVLSEMIKHHVKEEERPGGMFAEARKSAMDLDRVGQQMKARKEQLLENGGLPSLAKARLAA